MRDVNDLLASHAGEEVLVASRHPDDLVREDRADDERHVVLDDGAVEPDLDLLAEPSVGQLFYAGGGDRAEIGEGVRVPPLVIGDGCPRVGRCQALGCVPQELSQRVVAHGGVRAECDKDRESADPAVQGPVYRPEEQGQWADSGRVGHEHADAPVVEVVASQLFGDERLHLVAGQERIRAADARGAQAHDWHFPPRGAVPARPQGNSLQPLHPCLRRGQHLTMHRLLAPCPEGVQPTAEPAPLSTSRSGRAPVPVSASAVAS